MEVVPGAGGEGEVEQLLGVGGEDGGHQQVPPQQELRRQLLTPAELPVLYLLPGGEVRLRVVEGERADQGEPALGPVELQRPQHWQQPVPVLHQAKQCH